jgi:four helix bundle protein
MRQIAGEISNKLIMVTKKFRELIALQGVHPFGLTIWKDTEQFPKSELYGPASPSGRTSASMAANAAEEYEKKEKADNARFFNIAQGSIKECQYDLILSQDLGYGDPTNLVNLFDEMSKMSEVYISGILNSAS